MPELSEQQFKDLMDRFGSRRDTDVDQMLGQPTQVSKGLERHAQSIIVAVTLALLLWVGFTLSENSKTIARIDERVISLGREITVLKEKADEASDDRYTSGDARQDQKALTATIEQLTLRIDSAEDKFVRYPEYNEVKDSLQKSMLILETRVHELESKRGSK